MVALFFVYTFFKKMWGQQEGNPSNIKTIQGIRYFLLILVKLYHFFYQNMHIISYTLVTKVTLDAAISQEFFWV